MVEPENLLQFFRGRDWILPEPAVIPQPYTITVSNVNWGCL